VAFLLGCLAGAGVDIFRRRIPNLICLGLFLGGIAQAVALGGAGMWLWHLLFAVLSLIGGATLFRFGWFGAGDAKFLAAVSAWFPLSKAPQLLIAISLSGLGVFLVWFAYRRIRGAKISRPSDSPFEQLPYGVAICAGALIVAFSDGALLGL
jgi:prepilin peptidase CpaA